MAVAALEKRAYDVREYEVSLANAIAADDIISSVTMVDVVERDADGDLTTVNSFTVSDESATAGVVSFTIAGGGSVRRLENRFFVRIQCALTGGVQRVEVLVPLNVLS